MRATSLRADRADLIVIGAGLAGLITAAFVARAGRKVVVLERAGRPGGRAITRVDGGIHFNLGPHALYCRGHAFRLLRELGILFSGGFPDTRRAVLTDGRRAYRLPRGAGSALASRLLTVRDKARFFRLFAMLPRLDARPFDRVTLREWISETAGHGNLARLMGTLCRVGTYADDPEHLSAGAAIEQLKNTLAGGVWYLDGGWQVLIDGLREYVTKHGVELATSARVVAVRGDAGGVAAITASGEERLGRTAVLAIDPEGAGDLLEMPDNSPLAMWTARSVPVRAACLDVALNHLPRRDRRVAFGLDRPYYFSVHSASARLAPDGVAVLHAMKYLGTEPDSPAEFDEAQLEAYLETLQPGWRGHVVTRRFLPAMTVAHNLPRADEGGLAGRPAVTVPGSPNVFLAGDWVGDQGLLADASAASAAEAARHVIEALDSGPITSRGSVSHANV